MKYLLRLFSIAALLMLSMQAAYCADIGGFRGMQWGDTPDKLGQSAVVENDGDLIVRKRYGDKMAIGEGQVTDIVYMFYKNQLSAVMIRFKGYTNYSIIQAATEANYGQPWQPNQFMKTFYWRNDAKGFIAMVYKEGVNDGTLLFESKDLKAKEEADKKVKASQAAKTDF